MKKISFLIAVIPLLISCNAPKEESAAPASTVTLPYTAAYSSDFTDDVSDEDLLTVLNSYKAWETGDIPTLISYMGDTLTYVSSQGEMFSGPTAEITKDWQAYRDSISSVKIEMYAWRKNHSVDKNENVITLWYDEFVTHKSGKVDSAAWHDINVVSDGKIIWYSQYRRPFVKR